MIKRKFEDEMSNVNQDRNNASSSLQYVHDSIESDANDIYDHDSTEKISKQQQLLD